ncbi:MAG: cytidine deaminase [Bacteroidales bacterium]
MENLVIKTNIKVYNLEELSSEDRQLVDMAREATTRAYAPYSEFHVGAAALLENGEIITGNNQENAAYPSGLCAERVTLFWANSKYPDMPVKTIALAAFTNGEFTKECVAPCGACRQVMLETEDRGGEPMRILLSGRDQVYEVDSIKDILPLYFEKSNLGHK